MLEKDLYLHIPIQLISCTDTDGHVTPMRFRFRAPSDELITVNVDEVISYKKTAADIRICVYATIYDRRRLIDINYHTHEGAWTIDWVKS